MQEMAIQKNAYSTFFSFSFLFVSFLLNENEINLHTWGIIWKENGLLCTFLFFFVKPWLQLDTDIKKYQVGIEVEAH